VKQKSDFKKHLEIHRNNNNVIRKEGIRVSVIKKPVSNKTTIKNLIPNVTCDICQITLREDYLKRQTKHQKSMQSDSICVDEKNAIFMVMKSKSGVPFPIHVQKLLHGNKPKVVCK